MVAHCNELRMKIVVQGDFPLQISVKQFLDGIVVFQLLGYQPMPFQDSFRVRVHDKNGLAGGIENHAVCRLLANPFDGQQFLSKQAAFGCKKRLQASTVALNQMIDEIPQPDGLDVEIACRFDPAG